LVVKSTPLFEYINRSIWACLLPLFLLLSYGAATHVGQGQLAVAGEANNFSRDVARSIDQFLNAHIGGLEVLSASFQSDRDLRYRELFDNSRAYYKSFGSHVVMADLNGNMLLNTRTEYGSALPKMPQPQGNSAAALAIQSGRPSIGDTFIGPVAKQKLVAIAVPVVRQGKTVFVLLSTIEARQFETFLQGNQLPKNWTVTLLDSRDQVISQQPSLVTDVRMSGGNVHHFKSRLAASPWTVVVDIPDTAYYAPATDTALLLVGAILLTTSLSILCGKWASRRISDGVASLAQDPWSARPALDIAEVSMVKRILDEAALARNLAQANMDRVHGRFQRIFHDAPMPLCILSKDGSISAVNSRFVEVFGSLSADVTTHAAWWERTCPDPSYRQWAMNSWNASLSNPHRDDVDIESAQFRLECKDGVRMFTMFGTKLDDETLVTFFDNTKQRLSEERYRLTIEATRDGLWDLNLVTDSVFLTSRYYEMSGYFPGEVEANTQFLKQTVHPDDWYRVTESNKAHMRGETSASECDYRMLTRTGEAKWMESRARVVERDVSGNPVRMVGVITDIGKRKAMEVALTDSEAFAKSVLDSVTSHIAVLDPSGFILAVNAPWQRFAIENSSQNGLAAPRTGIGINYLDICSSESPDNAQSALSASVGIRSVLSGSLPEFSMEYPCHSSTLRRWFVMHATPMGGNTPGAVIVHTDITARKMAELERKRADSLATRLSIFAQAAVNYAFLMLDANANIVEWSIGAEALTLTSYKHALGRPFASLFTQDCNASGRTEQLLHEARSAGSAVVKENVVRADRTEFVGSGNLYWLSDGTENAAYAVVLSDITAAQQVSLRVAQSEARLAAVITEAQAAIVSTDVQGLVQMFNPAAEQLFKVSASQVVGQSLDRFIYTGTGSRHLEFMPDYSKSTITRRPMGSGTVRAINAQGEELELDASISRAQINGTIVLTAIFRDVTERNKTERMLAQYRLQLEGLAAQLLEQEKVTTQHLAQVLHDELGQTLAALRLIFDSKNAALSENALYVSWAARMERLIQQANRQARQVLTDLRPPLLDELGLVAAIDNEIGQRQRNHDHILFCVDSTNVTENERWSSEVEYAVFMIAREAINNALLHAAPSQVDLTISGDASCLELTVQDDGPGIGALDAIQSTGHFGMIGMRERASAIGAKFGVANAQGTGTGTGTRVNLVWRRPA
jgi:PAS domain S-box-containing protein